MDKETIVEQARISLAEFLQTNTSSDLTKKSFARYTSMRLMTQEEWQKEFDSFCSGKL